MPSSNDIRATFLDFFTRNGHTAVASSPLVPRNDPTLLFTNSGMVQFKNVFTGAEKRPYARATTAQKCVRAGGKHNDLDNVGYTARHHTFFEMLGNFSFGDYFKPLAIEHAWTLLTRDFALPKQKLLVTVYSEDDEAAALWKRIAGLGDDRIIRIPTSDNFWRMGDTGPCGPCSEIFYDHGDGIPGGPPGSPDEDGDRFIEIWNLVFMQFEEGPPGVRAPLPRPSIDTGMGMERFAAILQGVHDNYDTDTFRALILASADATGQEPDGPFRASHRVVADHLRSTSFLIAEGVLPSNEGRGYVLRRIMRRAMRHLHMMGAREPTMWRLVPALVRQMGAAYPELPQAESLIIETLRLEETRFKAMLERGLHLLADETDQAGRHAGAARRCRIPPLRHLRLPAGPDAGRVARAGAHRGRQRVRRGHGGAAHPRPRRLGRHRRRGGRARVVRAAGGGRRHRIPGLHHRKGRGAGDRAGDRRHGGAAAEAGDKVAVVLNQTPFYAESGGQVGDIGTITGADGLRIAVTDTQKRAGELFAHIGVVEAGQGRRSAPPSWQRGGPCPPGGDPGASQRHPSVARGAAPPAGHACGAEGQPERARPAALRREPADADRQGRPEGGRGRGQRPHPRERPRHHPADDAGGRGGRGRDGAVRREIR